MYRKRGRNCILFLDYIENLTSIIGADTMKTQYENERISFKLVLLFLFVLLISGCATTKEFSSIEKLNTDANIQKIAVMPIGVTLSILTAGGVLEPQAEWTKNAEKNINYAMKIIDRNRNSSFVKYQQPEETSSYYKTIIEHERLHRAIGQAILFNKYQFPLPTKKDVFDWTLGSGTKAIKEYTNANYALFIYLKDSYSSGGRVLVQIFAALLGVGVSGGQQAGFASLVDLSSGDVVWFNYLSSTAGDLRTEEPALKTVELLLKDLPD